MSARCWRRSSLPRSVTSAVSTAHSSCAPGWLTPRHRESDTTVHRGQITKQGSPLLRWAAIEAVQRLSRGPVGATRIRVGARRGSNIGKVAAGRKLLTLVFYGLRDGHIRALSTRPA